jgi:hypothetical protein
VVQPPNAPAPTTIIELREKLANARDPIRYAPAAPELVKKVRRELLLMRFMENSSNLVTAIWAAFPGFLNYVMTNPFLPRCSLVFPKEYFHLIS